MDRKLLRLIYVVGFLQLLFQGAIGQLTGTLTSPGNPFIITATITNPSGNTISILSWNNVFDNTTQLPVSFSVNDDQGNPVQLASTYAMRAGMTNDDLYDILPGQTFSRVFDMRQFLQSVPSGPTALQPKTISISLPQVFKGISHSGSYQIPAAAASFITATPPLGDFSAAGLQDISLNSTPLKLSYNFPIFPDLDPGYSNPADGIQIQTGDCQSQNFTDLSNAIFDAGVYAKSVYLAATNTTSALFADFFNAGQDAETVALISTLVMNATNGSGPHVDVYCTDGLNLCDSDSNILGYSSTPSWLGNAYITLCPSARNLGRAPVPCTSIGAESISATASHIMFHLILTVNNVVRTMIDDSVYGSTASQQLRNSQVWDRTKNADSYAQLAIVQWDFGLGGSPYSGQSCYPVDGNPPHIPKMRGLQTHSVSSRHIPHRTSNRSSDHIRRQTGSYSGLDQLVAAASRCTHAENQLLQNAIQNARAIATLARDNPYTTLWTEYFNGDPTVQAIVRSVYDNIANWNTNGNTQGINIYCDPLRRTSSCFSGRIAQISHSPLGSSTQRAVLVLCPAFFYYPASIQCLNPATMKNNLGGDLDQAGTLIHEFSHIPWIANNAIVTDGFIPGMGGCYDFGCVTAFAAQRHTPGFDPRNRPEVVATAYEYYAYAVRATTAGCSWTGYAGGTYGLGAWFG